MNPKLLLICWLCLLGLAEPFARASDTDEIIRMPTYVVTDSSLLPKPEAWRYARVHDFEVLSNASDSASQRVVRDLEEFQFAVSVVWPAIQPRSPLPSALILCGNHGKFSDFVSHTASDANSGTASLFVHDQEQAAVILDMQTAALDVETTAAGTPEDPSNPDRGVEVDYAVQLHREYVHFLLSRMNPRPQPWLEEGLAQLMASMTFDTKEIVFAQLPDPNEGTAEEALAALAGNGVKVNGPAQDKAFNAALAQGHLMSLGQMFAVTRDSPEAVNTIAGRWAKQCWLFVHLCLYGEHQRYLRPFAEFVSRSQREPITEDLFKQCFKMSYNDMLFEFRSYAQDTAYKSIKFKPKQGRIPAPPTVAWRDASEAEVGRIKGDALRLAGLKDSAHAALIAPYMRGSRDPDLLAALGLDEHADGQDDRAGPLLAAAVAGKTNRARAYLELGRIRLAQAEAKPAGTEARLNAAQLTQVLTPLLAGSTVPPMSPQMFEAIAEAWSRAEVKPTENNIRAVTKGVTLFPTDSKLVYQDALLNADIGLKGEADKLAGLGEATAANDVTREQFAALKASLER